MSHVAGEISTSTMISPFPTAQPSTFRVGEDRNLNSNRTPENDDVVLPVAPSGGSDDTESYRHPKSPEVLSSLLTETERCFLRRDYRHSLLLVNRFFRTATNSNSNSSSNAATRNGACDRTNKRKKCNRQFNRQEQRQWDKENGTIRLFPSIETTFPARNNVKPNSSRNNCNIQKHFTFTAHITSSSKESASQAETETSTPSPTARCEAVEEETMIDWLAAIGLQSWYELAKLEKRQRRKQHHQRNYRIDDANRWSFVIPIFDFYNHYGTEIEGHYDAHGNEGKKNIDSTRKIDFDPQMRDPGTLSLELLATVWIPFWESHGYPLHAFMWTIQTLHYCFSRRSSPRPRVSPTTTETYFTTTTETAAAAAAAAAIEDELWLRCVCEQIPMHVKHSTKLSQQILGIVTGWKETSIDGDDLERIWDGVTCNSNAENSSKDEKLFLKCLIDTLDVYLVCANNSTGDNTKSSTATSSNNRLPATGVSRRTLVRAREFLLQHQRRRRRRRRQQQQQNCGQNDLGFTIDHCVPEIEQKRSLDRNGQHRATKKSVHQLSSPPKIDSEGNGPRHSPVAFPSKSTTILQKVIVDAVKRLSNLFPSLFIASNWRSQIPKPLFHGVFAERGNETTIACDHDEGEGRGNKRAMTNFLKLFGSLFAVSVSDRSESAVEDAGVQERKPIRILRRHLNQVVLYFVVVAIGWRQRQFLRRSRNSLLSALYAPFRELLDVLESKRQHHHPPPIQPRSSSS